MSEREWWYLATAPVSVPAWTEAVWLEAEVEGESEAVPAVMLFSTREKAEAQLRSIEEQEPDDYLRAEGEWGEDRWNQALDNTPPLQVFAMGEWLLAEHLKDWTILYVAVDGEPRPVGEFVAGLGG